MLVHTNATPSLLCVLLLPFRPPDEQPAPKLSSQRSPLRCHQRGSIASYHHHRRFVFCWAHLSHPVFTAKMDIRRFFGKTAGGPSSTPSGGAGAKPASTSGKEEEKDKPTASSGMKVVWSLRCLCLASVNDYCRVYVGATQSRPRSRMERRNKSPQPRLGRGGTPHTGRCWGYHSGSTAD